MKAKKSFKGMTLVEIIIAMAILAIAGSVMCTACGFIAKMKITTNALTKKISYEAPIADTQNVSKFTVDGQEYMTATNPDSTKYVEQTYSVTDDDGNVVKTIDADGNEIDKQKKYNTVLTITDDKSNSYDVKAYIYEANYDTTINSTYGSENGLIDVNSDSSSHNFKFFVIGGIDTQ